MVRLIRSIIFVFLCVAVCQAAVPQALLIDRSGSMKPYYQDGFIRKVSLILFQALQPSGEVSIYAFGDTALPMKNLEQLDSLPFSSSTLIDKALDRAAKDKRSIIWIITDNIEDPPGSTDVGDTELFYKKLRSDAVDRVTIFPLRQQPGHPGLIIYALLLDESSLEVYEAGIATFQRDVAGILKTAALRMKPLDRDTVQVSFLRANVNPRTSLITYETGKAIHEQIEIRFKSRFDHIDIVDSEIRVTDGKPGFDGKSLVYPEKRQIEISPRRVTKLGAGDETAQVYIVDVDLGKLKLKNDLKSLWDAAWSRSSEDARLDLGFEVIVPQKNFRLRDKFLQEFQAGTLAEAKQTGKIYAIDKLPSLMSESVTDVRVASPLVFRVKYPAYPALVWILIFLVVILLIILLIVGVMRLLNGHNSDWQVTATTAGGASLDCQLENGAVQIQRENVGTILKNQLHAAPGVTLLDAKDHVALRSGLRVEIEARGRTIFLVFRTKGSPTPAPATASAPVPRRR